MPGHDGDPYPMALTGDEELGLTSLDESIEVGHCLNVWWEWRMLTPARPAHRWMITFLPLTQPA